MKIIMSLLLFLMFSLSINKQVCADNLIVGAGEKKQEAYYKLDYAFRKEVLELAKSSQFAEAKKKITERINANPSEKKGLDELEHLIAELEKEPNIANRKVQIEALSNVGQLENELFSIEPLIKSLASGEEKIKENTATALSYIKPTSQEIISSLEKAYSNDASLGLKLQIQSALQIIGTKEALDAKVRLKSQPLF